MNVRLLSMIPAALLLTAILPGLANAAPVTASNDIVAAETAADLAPPRRARRARILQRFDADGDGRLNGQERAAARDAMGERARGDRPGRRRGQRAQRGADERGLGRGPGRRGAADAAPGRRRGRRGDLFRRLDLDGDGVISADEFESARERLQASSRGPRGGAAEGRLGGRGARALRRFDADDDGRLSADERAAARDRMRSRARELRQRLERSGERPRGRRGVDGRRGAPPAADGSARSRRRRPVRE